MTITYTIGDALRDELSISAVATSPRLLSFGELAREAGTTTAVLRAILAGQHDLMTAELGARLMRALGGPSVRLHPGLYPRQMEVSDEPLYDWVDGVWTQVQRERWEPTPLTRRWSPRGHAR